MHTQGVRSGRIQSQGNRSRSLQPGVRSGLVNPLEEIRTPTDTWCPMRTPKAKKETVRTPTDTSCPVQTPKLPGMTREPVQTPTDSKCPVRTPLAARELVRTPSDLRCPVRKSAYTRCPVWTHTVRRERFRTPTARCLVRTPKSTGTNPDTLRYVVSHADA